MAPKSKKSQYIDEVKRLYIDGLKSLGEISEILGPSIQTLSRWLGEEGIELAARPRNPNAGRGEAEQQEINERIAARQRERIKAGGYHGGRSRMIEREDRACENPACSEVFEAPVTSPQRFCGLTCARSVGNKDRWADKRKMTTCPCGEVFYSPYAKKYCSDECRGIYTEKRQPDLANYITFNCLNCDVEVTRRKKYTQYAKYCSNECSAKHTRTKQHIVVEDAVVLDSGYEALFWGLCSLWKIPVERADRSQAVPVNGNGWYCPDFYVPSMNIWVEVKGFEDDDDRTRYAAWAQAGHHLTVLDRNGLIMMRAAKDERDFRSTLAAIVPASRYPAS